jgi:hypothetical protein
MPTLMRRCQLSILKGLRVRVASRLATGWVGHWHDPGLPVRVNWRYYHCTAIT